jgi:polysaccharide deacetylase family protein (PEP-CTERM system associated)
MINALCVDVEEWYCSEFLKGYLPTQLDDQIEESLDPLLDLLRKRGVRATFAILGRVAEGHPDAVRRISAGGHEIACHGYSHTMLQNLTQAQFRKEIETTVQLLYSVTGERPRGFRAPSFSLDNTTKWAIDILAEAGFEWDASVFPLRTILYGVPHAPLHIYRLSRVDVTSEDGESNLVEFPMTVLSLGRLRIPVAGGFYLRALPHWFLSWALRRVTQTRPAILYVHPWELLPGTPRIRHLPLLSRFVTYYGTRGALGKLDRLLQEFEFAPVGAVVRQTIGSPDQRRSARA